MRPEAWMYLALLSFVQPSLLAVSTCGSSLIAPSTSRVSTAATCLILIWVVPGLVKTSRRSDQANLFVIVCLQQSTIDPIPSSYRFVDGLRHLV